MSAACVTMRGLLNVSIAPARPFVAARNAGSKSAVSVHSRLEPDRPLGSQSTATRFTFGKVSLSNSNRFGVNGS